MTSKTIIAIIIAVAIAISVPTIYATIETDNDVFCEEKTSDGITTFADLVCESLKIDRGLVKSIAELQPINSTIIDELKNEINNLKIAFHTYTTWDKEEMNNTLSVLNQTNSDVDQLIINTNQTSIDVRDLQQRVTSLENPSIRFKTTIDYKQDIYHKGDTLFVSGIGTPAGNQTGNIEILYETINNVVYEKKYHINFDSTFSYLIQLNGDEWIPGTYYLNTYHPLDKVIFGHSFEIG